MRVRASLGRAVVAWAVVAWAVVAWSLLAGCRRGDVAERVSEPGPNERAPARKPLDLTPGAAPGEHRFGSDPWWQRARGGHEFDLLRLAEREGAVGLLEGVEVGHGIALTAFLALPSAEDAELALPRLCELLQQMQDAPNAALLECIRDIAGRPPTQREPLAPGAHAQCLPVVERLRKTRLDPVRHDLATSAVQLLLEHRDAAKH